LFNSPQYFCILSLFFNSFIQESIFRTIVLSRGYSLNNKASHFFTKELSMMKNGIGVMRAFLCLITAGVLLAGCPDPTETEKQPESAAFSGLSADGSSTATTYIAAASPALSILPLPVQVKKPCPYSTASKARAYLTATAARFPLPLTTLYRSFQTTLGTSAIPNYPRQAILSSLTTRITQSELTGLL
jgi:hypothetical protein